MYDHNVKAGNQGDVVKHSALIAAVDALLSTTDAPFRYADIFSGYAYNPLRSNGEWRYGIGALERSGLVPRTVAGKFWRDLWLCKTGLRGSVYPGSSSFVFKLCQARNRNYHARLWDTSPAVISQLMSVFETEDAEIFPRPARISDFTDSNTSLLLIDPPGLRTEAKKVYPDLEDLLSFFNEVQHAILWFPVSAEGKGSPARESSPSSKAYSRCIDFGLRVISVRWSNGVRTCGCRLAYRLPDTAGHIMYEAVADIAERMEWQISHE